MDDLNLPSGRRAEQVLDDVYERGHSLRRRRRAARAVPAAALAALVASPLLWSMTRSSGAAVRTIQPAASSTTTSTVGSAVTTATPAPTPTTRAPAAQPHLTPTSTSTSTTTTTTAVHACAEGDVTLSAVTDRDSYASRQTVTATSTVTNASGRPCEAPPYVGYSLLDGNGQVLWSVEPISDSGSASPPLQAGEHRDVSITWDQHYCTQSGPCSEYAPAGSYQFEFMWGPHESPWKTRTKPFTITG
jgi:hypothetical protein